MIPTCSHSSYLTMWCLLMYMAMLNNQRVTLVISTMNHSIHEPFNSPPRRHSLDRINKCLPYNVQSHQPDIARWHISTVSSPSETLCEIVWSCSPSSGSTGHIPWWDYPMIVWLSPLREKTTWWNIMMVFQVQSQVVCMCIYIWVPWLSPWSNIVKTGHNAYCWWFISTQS